MNSQLFDRAEKEKINPENHGPNAVLKPKTRLLLRAQVLHDGFGFGAEAMKSRSLNASWEQPQPSQKAPVPPSPSPLPRSPSTQPSPALSVLVRPSQKVASAYKNPSPLPVRPAKSEWVESKMPLGAPSERPENKVFLSVALAGALIDFILALCLVPIAAVTVYLFVSETVTLRAQPFFSQMPWLWLSQNAAKASWALCVTVLWTACLVVIQTLSVVGYHATLGRAVVGLRLSGKAYFSPLAAILLVFSEVFTLGGLVSLPILLCAPSRVPLFPWLRLGSIGEKERPNI